MTRGLVMSVACLFLPSTAHVAAGGAVPTHPGFLLVAALLSIACVGLADRRRTPVEIAVLLLFTQPALHVLLVLAGEHDPGGTVVPGGAMLIGHLAAAGVLTVLLSGAESVAWALASLSATVLMKRVRLLLDVPCPAGRPAPYQPPHGVLPSRVVALLRANPRRGPPALSFA